MDWTWGCAAPSSLDYSTSLYSLICWLVPCIMRVVTGGDKGQGPKTNSSHFLDHWAVLHLELCSRASCLEPFACGLSFSEHTEFLG